MSVADRMRDKLSAALRPERIAVLNESALHAGHRSSPGTGDSHFRVVVIAEAFSGLSRLERHRKINALLAEELAPGGVHALAIHAFAPGEAVDPSLSAALDA